jgi:hypothetical protein
MDRFDGDGNNKHNQEDREERLAILATEVGDMSPVGRGGGGSRVPKAWVLVSSSPAVRAGRRDHCLQTKK